MTDRLDWSLCVRVSSPGHQFNLEAVLSKKMKASLVAMLKLLSNATKGLEKAMEDVSDAAEDLKNTRLVTKQGRSDQGGVYINGKRFVAANDI